MINLRACETVSASTAFHSQELGFRTILVEDASRGIKVMLIMILIDMMLCDEDYDLVDSDDGVDGDDDIDWVGAGHRGSIC